MRVNIYAEEMTDRVELITKKIGEQEFTAVRFYTALPSTYVAAPPSIIPIPATNENTAGVKDEDLRQYQAPFIHHVGDDDSSAVTFWGKRDLRPLLRKALEMLDRHYSPVQTETV